MPTSPFEPRARVRAVLRRESTSDAGVNRRDTRGAGLFDAVLRDVAYACRSLRNAPLVAVTIVTTIGLGLGLVAVVFTIFNAAIFRADDVRNPHELFAVTRPTSADPRPRRFTRAEYEALLRETDVFVDAFALGPEVDRIIDGQRMRASSSAETSFRSSARAPRADARSRRQTTRRGTIT